MPHNWWTRKNFVLVVAVVALAFIGLRHDRRVLSRAGRQRCPRSGLALQPAGLCLHDLQPGQEQPVHGRARRKNPGVRAAADVIGSAAKWNWPKPELPMQKQSRAMAAASAAALVVLPAGVALAQGAPGGGTAPAAAPPAAPETKAPENTAPENTAPENEGGGEEKETGQDDPAAGDRPFGRQWHGARALPELSAERVSSVYSVR